MSYINLVKIFNILSIGIAGLLVVLFFKEILENDSLLIHSEYFINYQGGFVRRGFDGEILYNLYHFFEIPILLGTKLYSGSTFLLFLCIVMYATRKLKIPYYIVFSMTTLLLYLVYLDRGLRKDHIILSLIIIQSFVLRNFSKKNRLGTIVFIFISLIGTLIHEIFFIITLFPNLIGLYINSRNNIQLFLKNSLILLPSAILFILLIFVFKGNEGQAKAIILSYPNLTYNLDYLTLVFTKSFFFWNQNYHLKNIFYFFIFIGLHSLFILISVNNDIKSKVQKSIFNILFILQLLVLVVLCMIAIDYSRMLFLSFSTLVFYIYNYTLEKIKVILPFNVDCTNRIFSTLKYLPFILYFFLTMPHSGWDGFRGIVKYNLINLIKHKMYQ
ncbi:MAG: hypothetical protein JST62_11920 [Bacteroidetes bacterium]|nr:hypothetical protein [Bacteroidota bacterium]